jgi:hypothetical protein
MINLSNKKNFFLKLTLALFSIAVLLIAHNWSFKYFIVNRIIYRGPDAEDLIGILPNGILDQEFRYLGKGRQMLAFKSVDNKYVIKFIRYHQYQKPFWMDYFPLTARSKKLIVKKKADILKVISSCRIAKNIFKEETRLHFVHFGKTSNLKKKLIVRDKIGRKIEINLDDVAFVVQDTVEPFDEKFLKCANQKNDPAIEKMIISFLQSEKQRILKGIFNLDKSKYLQNIGYFENQFVTMDIGSFKIEKNKDLYLNEMSEFGGIFRSFIAKHYPQKLIFFDKNLEIYLKDLKEATK